MNKWLKRGLIGLGIMICLPVLAVVLVPAFVDVEKYRPQIEQKASEAMNRPVRLAGDLQLSVFPWAGVTISDFSVDNPEGFGEKQFISVKSFDVRVKLLPLLSKDIQVGRFVLREPKIILERTKDGKANWEGIGSATAETEQETETESPAAGRAMPIQALAVNDLSIIDGQFVFDDRRADQRREITELNLNLKDISFDSPVSIAFSAKIDGKPVSLEGTAGPVGRDIGKGTIPMDLALKALDQIDLSVSGSVTDPATDPKADLSVSLAAFSPRKVMETLGIPFPVETSDPGAFRELAMDLTFQGGRQALEKAAGKLTLDGSRLTFSIDDLKPEPPVIRFNFDLDAIDVTRYLPPQKETDGKSPKQKAQTASKPSAAGKGPDPALLEKMVIDGTGRIGSLKAPGTELEDIRLDIKGQNGQFKLALSAKSDGHPMALKTDLGPVQNENLPLSLDVSAFDAFKMQVDGTLLNFRKNPAIAASVKTGPFSPRKLTEMMGQPFPVKTADPSALNKVAFSGAVKAGKSQVSVSEGRITLDDTDIRMSLDAKGLEDRPNIRFEVTAGILDLDRYLPPKSADGNPKGETQEAPPADAPKKPADYTFLRKLTLDGRTRMKELKAGNARLRDIEMRITGKNGVFKLAPLAANLYEGSMNVAGNADFRDDAPKTRLSLKTSGIQINPLLIDVLEKDILEGKTDADVTLSMMGDSPEAIKKSLNGKGIMRFFDGAIKGVDLAGMVRNAETAYALFTGKAASESSQAAETPFTEMDTRFEIVNGLVQVPQMRLTSPVLHAESAGKADLNTETLNFNVTPKFVSGVGGKRVSLMIPVLVSGTFDKPVFRPDLVGVIRQVPKETVAEIIKDPKKGIQTLTDDLKNIFIQKENGTGDPAASEPDSEANQTQNGGSKKDGEKKVPIEKQIGDILKKIPFGQ